MSQPEQHPLMVFHDLENNPSGTRLAAWPLHITAVFFFTPEGVPLDKVLDLIADTSQEFDEVVIEPGDSVMYGDDHDIPATEFIDESGELARLHKRLIREIAQIGCRHTDLTYALHNYSPHISHKSGLVVPESSYVVNSISVAKKLPKAKTELNKLIIRKIPLGRY
jgi:2'-5' RNA ligase